MPLAAYIYEVILIFSIQQIIKYFFKTLSTFIFVFACRAIRCEVCVASFLIELSENTSICDLVSPYVTVLWHFPCRVLVS